MKSRNGSTVLVIVIILCIIIASWGLVYGSQWFYYRTYNNQEYEVTFTVYSSEQSTRFGAHTNVQYGVSEGTVREYHLIGHHDFEVGKTYHVVFTNRMLFHWYKGYFIRGEVEILEQIS